MMPSRLDRNTKAGIFYGIVGSLVTGLVISAFFWWASEKSKDLTFAISPTRPDIVRSGLASDLTVLYKGVDIAGNLSAIQLAIWNKGRDPIRQPEDILRVVTIRPATGMKILEAKVVSATREEIEFSIAPPAANGDIVLKWRILENGDGAVVQLLVVNAPDEPVTVSGSIVGQGALETTSIRNSPRLASSETGLTQSLTQAKDGMSVGRIVRLLGVVAFACCGLALGIYAFILQRGRDGTRWKTATVNLVVMIGIVVLLLVMVFQFEQGISPFGF